jgi:hypothetical protein
VLTKDELEIKELIESQSSSLPRVISNQSARTHSALSTKVYDTYIDLTKQPEESLPALAEPTIGVTLLLKFQDRDAHSTQVPCMEQYSPIDIVQLLE